MIVILTLGKQRMIVILTLGKQRKIEILTLGKQNDNNTDLRKTENVDWLL
jgi:hypothetical protein